MIALREAARGTPKTAATALTFEPIKRGVQAASINRVEQLKEDYAWIDEVLKPLAGLQTPNDEKKFVERWRDEDTIKTILDSSNELAENYLIPVELQGVTLSDPARHTKLLGALINLGIAEKRPDKRINIPDLFQVASGMLRKGGVAPKM